MTEQNNIQVLFRIRPLIKQETEFSWDINTDENKIQLLPTLQEKYNSQPFQFTKIYDETATNADLFSTSIEGLLPKLLEGQNCTILAYGQSSSGKTSTMFEGPHGEPGLTGLIVERLFELVAGTEFLVKAQYLEIYNEQMVDLLSAQRGQPVMREENGQIVLSNVTEPKIQALAELVALVEQGNRRRAVSETGLNERSSRSHAIIRLVLQQGEQLNLPTKRGFRVTRQSCLTLVDLAGSERVQKTNVQGRRLKESNNINQSLLTLGLVISQLSNHQTFINYRDSKLTRLLQNSLGGAAITLVIGCISPAVQNVEESISTMRFCQRAMKVQNKTIKTTAMSALQQPSREKQEQLILQNRTLRLRVQELEKQLNVAQSQCQSLTNCSSFVYDDGEVNLAELSQYLRAEESGNRQDVALQTSILQASQQTDNQAPLQEQIQQYVDQQAAMETENEHLREQIVRLNGQQAAHDGILAQLKQKELDLLNKEEQLNGAVFEKERLERQLEEAVKDQAKDATEISLLEQKIEAQAEQLAAQRQLYCDLQTRYQSMDEAVKDGQASHEEEVSMLRDQSKQLHQEVERLMLQRQFFSRLSDEQGQQISTLVAEQKTITDKIKQMQGAMAALQADHDAAKREDEGAKQLEQRLLARQLELEQLHKDHKSVTALLDENRQKCAQLQAIIDENRMQEQLKRDGMRSIAIQLQSIVLQSQGVNTSGISKNSAALQVGSSSYSGEQEEGIQQASNRTNHLSTAQSKRSAQQAFPTTDAKPVSQCDEKDIMGCHSQCGDGSTHGAKQQDKQPRADNMGTPTVMLEASTKVGSTYVDALETILSVEETKKKSSLNLSDLTKSNSSRGEGSVAVLPLQSDQSNKSRVSLTTGQQDHSVQAAGLLQSFCNQTTPAVAVETGACKTPIVVCVTDMQTSPAHHSVGIQSAQNDIVCFSKSQQAGGVAIPTETQTTPLAMCSVSVSRTPVILIDEGTDCNTLSELGVQTEHLDEERPSGLQGAELKSILAEIVEQLRLFSQERSKPALISGSTTRNYDFQQLAAQINSIIATQFTSDGQRQQQDDKIHQLQLEVDQLRQRLRLLDEQKKLDTAALTEELATREREVQGLKAQVHNHATANEVLLCDIDRLYGKLREQEDQTQQFQESIVSNNIEMTQKIIEITQLHEVVAAQTQQTEGEGNYTVAEQIDYKGLYEQSEAKFSRLLQQSRDTIQKIMAVAREREANLQRKAAEQVQNMQKYKEIVMRMQVRAKQQQQTVQFQQKVIQQQLQQQGSNEIAHE